MPLLSTWWAALTRIRTSRLLLLLGTGVFLGLAPILVHRGVLPLSPVNVIFFAFLTYLAALYRPGWVFLILVAVVPLEIVNVLPLDWGGIELRPYQFMAGMLVLALITRATMRTLPFRLMRPQWYDALLLLLALGGFLSITISPEPALSFKQALIVTTFVGLYFLGRIFFRTLVDLRQALPFFVLSSTLVAGYALWQNVRSLVGLPSYQVMAGRPNALFSESDWLGMFLLLPLGVALFLLSELVSSRTKHGELVPRFFHWVGLLSYLVLIETTLLLTMARSAWLGAVALVVCFLACYLIRLKLETGRLFGRRWWLFLVPFLSTSLASLAFLIYTPLSPFPLLERIESTGGLQTITISCDERRSLPEAIASIDDLSALGCRHITLEAIESEQNEGRYVTTVDRPDPNVTIRGEIYGRVTRILTDHLWLGLGWGSITTLLGTDERGAGLNASNVFLEVWLGSGIIGLSVFVIFLVYVSLRLLTNVCNPEVDDFGLLSGALLAILIGLTVFNLFNSGILLGFYFMFLSVVALLAEKR